MIKNRKKLREFIKHEIWRISFKNKNQYRATLIRSLQVFLIAIRGFTEDKIKLRASALTFYTLLSIVPVLAMAFGIATGFGFKDWLIKELQKLFKAQQEIMENLVTFAENMLERTSGGLIAVIGFAFVLWSVIKVLSNIESSFNDIWQIKRSRVFVRKFSDYLSLIVIAPILLFLSSGATITKFTAIGDENGILSYFGPVITMVVNILPYTLIWLVLTLIYIIMPNTKVEFKSGVIAGVIAGTAYQLFQWAYIQSQSWLTGYNEIYGSFAALPLFLIWLRISWLIVLFGAEISYAIQNVQNYEFESDALNISAHRKKGFLLLTAHKIIDRFKHGNTPLIAIELSRQLEIPIRLMNQLLQVLVDAGIILETRTDDSKEGAFVPAIDIDQLTAGFILEKIESYGKDHIILNNSEIMAQINDYMNHYTNVLKEEKKLKLKDI
ncbi:MAG: YihY family inner membrane protein [Bacteroidetes bacterium]|jgi:membrane protein|nr:YihY family inner membrane protein [Bacteroidota bacterium]